MMEVKTVGFFENFVKEVLDKNKIEFKSIKITIPAKNYHHQGVDIFIVIDKCAKYKYGRSYNISFSSPPWGCGTILMHNHAYLSDTLIDPLIKELIDYYVADGAGTIFATKGGYDWDNCKTLQRLGFKLLHTYANLAHPKSDDMQGIYAYTAERDPSDYEDDDDYDEDDDDDDDD